MPLNESNQPQHSTGTKRESRSSVPRNEVMLEEIEPELFDLTGEEAEQSSMKTLQKSFSSKSRSLTSLVESEIVQLTDSLSATKTRKPRQAGSSDSQSLSSASVMEELRQSERSKHFSEFDSLDESGWDSHVSLVSDSGFDSKAILAASTVSFLSDEMPSLCGFDSFHSHCQNSVDSLSGFHSISSSDLPLASIDKELSILSMKARKRISPSDLALESVDEEQSIKCSKSKRADVSRRPRLICNISPTPPITRRNMLLQHSPCSPTGKPIRSVLKVTSNEYQADVRLLRDERWQTNGF